MAKVTVYLTDDQMERLRAVKGAGRGGVSKLFQAFVESATGGERSDSGDRYDYARSLMPTLTAIDAHRRRLARTVQAGGPAADGGPVSIALTILLYRELLERDPDLAATLDKEFARFGLDDLVAKETDGIDLTTPPSPTAADDEDAEPAFSWERSVGNLAGATGLGGLGAMGDLGGLGSRLGDEVREALKHVGVIRESLKDLTGEREMHIRAGGSRRARRTLVVEVSPGDDPRDLLSVTDFATFTARHADWDAGSRLSPSQMETVRELLIRRAGGDPEADLDDVDAGDDATEERDGTGEVNSEVRVEHEPSGSSTNDGNSEATGGDSGPESGS